MAHTTIRATNNGALERDTKGSSKNASAEIAVSAATSRPTRPITRATRSVAAPAAQSHTAKMS
ncbi:hypothetical protein BHQ21_05810 [Mycobacterium sherrisii]|uniref:Uncharacterized protein n=1 Tax=Mycobacterium sherrisii TaxID=243061 RepID=A0A1E3T2Q1_9MYCO|nr:hypothetical protein [Mycobacterium sherrisii]ODR08696.1 hypothetical protein BHQ21_05810 [Mycobacterium sherrisii]